MREKYRNLLHALSDTGMSLQERLFRLIMTIGLIGIFVGTLIGLALGESIYSTLMLLGAIAVFAVITALSIHFRKIQAGAVITSLLVLLFVLPYNFFTTGGVYGGAPIWFLFGVVYVCLVVENRIKYVLLAVAFLVDAACFYFSFYHPQYVIPHTIKMAYEDAFFSMMAVGVLTCALIVFQNRVFHQENTLVKQQKKEIEELGKMQNRFFSSMSHEIRTPINTVIGLNEMILREKVSPEVAENAKNIESASQMLLALINDILDMSKIESGKMDIVPVVYDVGEMLSALVGMIWVRAKKKGLEFHIDVDRSMPAKFYGDEVRIKQILVNILNNAIKYTSEGSVTLSIACERQENGMVQVVYTVTDTGMGIKREQIPHLFQAFRRVDEERNRNIEGTGLGLAIVKQLVDLMGGEVTVNSVYTKGSTFMVTLPQKPADEQELGELNLEMRHALNEHKHYKQSFEAPNAHVLIVDDNETNLMVAEKLLRATRMQIDTVMSGEECLKKTFEKRYDVILMDHMMPGMDGIECLHALRSQSGGLNQDVPVVALTANAGSENQERYRREGFDGYLLKPVTGIQLERELLQHLPREVLSVVAGEDTTDITAGALIRHHRKVPVIICTDSVCDLPASMIEEHKIAVMPYRVCTEGGEFLDGVETESDGVLSYLCNSGKSVHSHAPEVKDYEQFFSEQLTQAQYVIHITMAKHASQGYANACEAAQVFDNVKVIDSGHLSSGMGLVVLRAAHYAARGMDPEHLIRRVQDDCIRVRTSFIVDTTRYLAREGRLSDRLHRFCKMMLLHPVLVMKNDSIRVGAIQIGTKEQSRENYISSVLRKSKNMDRKILFLTYAGLDERELRQIIQQVNAKVKFEQIICQKASSAILTNCGPGSFGLIYMLKP